MSSAKNSSSRLRPSLHSRSASSPGTISFVFSRLALDPRHAKYRPSSPTRRRILRRHSIVVAGINMDGHGDSLKRPHENNDQRPPLPPRQVSYSKRHASFNSPREIPLPSSPSSQPYQFTTTSPSHALGSRSRITGSSSQRQDEYSVFECDDSGDESLPSVPSSPRNMSPLPSRRTDLNEPSDHDTPVQGDPQQENRDFPMDVDQIQQSEHPAPRASPSAAGTLLPVSRPYSLPAPETFDPHLNIHSPVPRRPIWSDRSSTSSLPLPMQTPYSTLPQVRPESPVDEEMEQRQTNSADPEHQQASRSLTDLSEQPSQPPPGPGSQFKPSYNTQDKTLPGSFSRSSCSMPMPEPSAVASGSRSLATVQPLAYPPPAPPVVLTPPPPEDEATEPRSRAPHEPFLSHAPPPADSWISVETVRTEYRLIIRLPGFRREGITLATRRRRVLHVVADSWEAGGGHFERRISFGYDADLAQVRAEFDGEMLRVIVPRRLPPVNIFFTGPAPSGPKDDSDNNNNPPDNNPGGSSETPTATAY